MEEQSTKQLTGALQNCQGHEGQGKPGDTKEAQQLNATWDPRIEKRC